MNRLLYRTVYDTNFVRMRISGCIGLLDPLVVHTQLWPLYTVSGLPPKALSYPLVKKAHAATS